MTMARAAFTSSLRRAPLVAGLLCLVCTGVFAQDGQQLLQLGRADEAIRLLTPAAGTNPMAANQLCRAYFSIGQWDNAVHHCQRAVQLDSRNASFQLWLGRAYGEKANASSALSAFSTARKSVAAFEAAHALDRQNEAIARDLGEYYIQAPGIVGGGMSKAMALASEMAPQHPVTAAWIRARAAGKQGDQSAAEREYLESIRLSGDSAEMHLEFCRYLNGQKQWDRFDQQIAAALRSPRLRPQDRYDAAEQLLHAGRQLPLAAEQMRAYIASGHPDAESPLFRAHFLLGEILRGLGKPSDAATEYRAALALANAYRPAQDALRRLERP
jgi:tetratricopeptide (TPR) repeat protein